MPTTIEEFTATICRRSGLARPNRFKIDMMCPSVGDISDMRDITLMCESCTLPSRSITTLDYRLLRQSRKIANGYTNTDVSFTFHLTNDYMMRTIFDRWLNLIIDVNSYRAQYAEGYSTVVDITQLDLNNMPVYSVKLLQAYPISMQAIALDNNQNDSTQKIVVDFTYDDYIINTLTNNSTSNASYLKNSSIAKLPLASDISYLKNSSIGKDSIGLPGDRL